MFEGDMVAAKRFLTEKPAIPDGARLGKNGNGEAAYFIEDPIKIQSSLSWDNSSDSIALS